jgi:hypothetical protein
MNAIYRQSLIYIGVIVAVLAIFIWSSDHITLEGERTVYTVNCEHGEWDGLRCSGRVAAGDRYRFRSSRSRHEVAYWIAGSPKPSGKFTDCDVTDRDLWSCKPQPGEPPTVAHALSDGRPVAQDAGHDLPFHAVTKWKWWALRLGIPMFGRADYSNSLNPRLPKLRAADGPMPAH